MQVKPQLAVFFFIAMTCLLLVGVARHFAEVEREELVIGIAESYVAALNEMHEYYSQVVATRAVSLGVPLSHDLERDKDALPFPATFFNALGRRLDSVVRGLSARLYSEHPFPWAAARELSPSQREVLRALRNNPDRSVVYRTDVDGTEVLHLARPLMMKESCVACHNALGSRVWRVGEFRGVREVSLPLTAGPSKNPRSYWLAAILCLLAAGLGGLLVWPTVARLNKALAEAHRLRGELEYSATHDHLTGLPALRLARDRLEQAIALSRRNGTLTAVLFVDLDGFKTVNDTMGHDSGDQVLTAAADRLREAVRESDTAARIGGDEFLVILGNLTDSAPALQAAGRIVASIGRPFTLRDGEVNIGASVGIALFPDDGTDAETLLRTSDDAMYRAKREGKGAFRAGAGAGI